MKKKLKWNYYSKKKKYLIPKLNKGKIEQKDNSWVKRSPIKNGPPSPKLGYEGSIAYDEKNNLLIRHAGHNQGGGGEQHFETWTYELKTGKWKMIYPNTSPPGTCCSRNNVFDQANNRFLRFPGFTGSHGWQWSKRIHNEESSVWSFNPNENIWTNMKPIQKMSIGPTRAIAYDSNNQIILAFNAGGFGKTAIYDLYTNSWYQLETKKDAPGKSFYNPGMSMCYDSDNKVFILFGVGDGTDSRTFIFNLKDNEWKDANPKNSPTFYEADPLLIYDSNNHITIAILQNNRTKFLETWTYNPKKNDWKKINPDKEPDFSNHRRRELTYSKNQNLVILENRTQTGNYKTDEQQIWTYKYKNIKENEQKPPKEIKLETKKDEINLSWKKDKSKFYNIYHGIAEKPWLVDYKKIASVKTNYFIHKNPEKNKINYYYIVSINSKNKESKPSLKVRSQPKVITNIIVSPLFENKVEIEWKTKNKDISGYNIYRAKIAFQDGFLIKIENFEKINKELIKENIFINKTKKDEDFTYIIQAVNKIGIESGFSPYILTIPSPPQYIFSKEDDNDCKLKWQKNPEKNIVGYNIYRTIDRWDDNPELLNKTPIKTTNYTDKNAKKNMPQKPGNSGRRYYITAINKFGKESFPSYPVWFYKEWHKFYKLEVWHQ